MDEVAIEESIQNVIDILEVDYMDNEKLVRKYLNRAIKYVKSYCGITEIPESLYETVEDITIFRFRGKGIENIKSEGKGSLSESYIESLPTDIIKQLNQHRRLKFV
jgi:hypothetical protein